MTVVLKVSLLAAASALSFRCQTGTFRWPNETFPGQYEYVHYLPEGKRIVFLALKVDQAMTKV
jgi:hypothetical protein